MTLEFTAKCIVALPVHKGVSKSSGKEWTMQEYVFETDDPNVRYQSRCIAGVFGSDKIGQYAIEQGKMYTVRCSPNAREYTDKDGNQRWSGSLNIFFCQPAQVGQQAPQQIAPMATLFPPAPMAQHQQQAESPNDLPF